MSLKLAYRGWRQVNAHLYASLQFSSHRVSFEQSFFFTTLVGTLTRQPATSSAPRSVFIFHSEEYPSFFAIYMPLIIRVISLVQAVLAALRRYLLLYYSNESATLSEITALKDVFRHSTSYSHYYPSPERNDATECRSWNDGKWIWKWIHFDDLSRSSNMKLQNRKRIGNWHAPMSLARNLGCMMHDSLTILLR